jgi:hypothetical protein
MHGVFSVQVASSRLAAIRGQARPPRAPQGRGEKKKVEPDAKKKYRGGRTTGVKFRRRVPCFRGSSPTLALLR